MVKISTLRRPSLNKQKFLAKKVWTTKREKIWKPEDVKLFKMCCMKTLMMQNTLRLTNKKVFLIHKDCMDSSIVILKNRTNQMYDNIIELERKHRLEIETGMLVETKVERARRYIEFTNEKITPPQDFEDKFAVLASETFCDHIYKDIPDGEWKKFKYTYYYSLHHELTYSDYVSAHDGLTIENFDGYYDKIRKYAKMGAVIDAKNLFYNAEFGWSIKSLEFFPKLSEKKLILKSLQSLKLSNKDQLLREKIDNIKKVFVAEPTIKTEDHTKNRLPCYACGMG